MAKQNNAEGCLGSLQQCLQILPQQWPLIGASAHMLQLYESDASDGSGNAPMPQAQAPAASLAPCDVETQSLSAAQLKQEISMLEQHLQDVAGGSCPRVPSPHRLEERKKPPPPTPSALLRKWPVLRRADLFFLRTQNGFMKGKLMVQ